MYDALHINSALKGSPIANNAISIEAAVWLDAFQTLPSPPASLNYTYINKYGTVKSISLTLGQIQQVSWYGWFGSDTASLSGVIMNSYTSNDYALNAMSANDANNREDGEIDPTSVVKTPPVFRSELDIFDLPTLIAPGADITTSGAQSKSTDPPLGQTTNPMAKVNFNTNQTNWTTNGKFGAAHGDFRDLNYPTIWTWWSQYLTANKAMAINDEK